MVVLFTTYLTTVKCDEKFSLCVKLLCCTSSRGGAGEKSLAYIPQVGRSSIIF